MDTRGVPGRLRALPTQISTPTSTPSRRPAPRLSPLRYVHHSLTTQTHKTKKKGSTDVPFFASPLEFVLHAEWLMRGAHRTPDKSRAPRCACKYCDVDVRGRKQSEISRELRARRARVLVLLAEDGDGDGNADADADDADELANDT